MTLICELTLPGRPIPWVRSGEDGRRKGKKRHFDPQDKIKAQWGMLARAAMQQAGGTMAEKHVPVYFEMLCVYDIPVSWPQYKQRAAREGKIYMTSRPDKDNLEKLPMDAFNGIVYADDAQIAKGSFLKRFGEPARTVMRFTVLPDWKG